MVAGRLILLHACHSFLLLSSTFRTTARACLNDRNVLGGDAGAGRCIILLGDLGIKIAQYSSVLEEIVPVAGALVLVLAAVAFVALALGVELAFLRLSPAPLRGRLAVQGGDFQGGPLRGSTSIVVCAFFVVSVPVHERRLSVS